MPHRPFRPRYPTLLALALLSPLAHAQAPASGAAAPDDAWRRCAALSHDASARLACFDAWAGQQAWQAPAAMRPAASDTGTAPVAVAQAPESAAPASDGARGGGCRNPQFTSLSRFWELETGSDCGTFSFRGYRPITASVVAASSVNRQPSSDAPDHSAPTPVPYRSTEMSLQLSVRTKFAQGLLTHHDSPGKDSLWFGYTQKSYWQLFNPGISRPFRTTDHEPEVIYVYPTDAQLPWGWRWRYSGVGIVHQSNGQSLPLSRSWNRAYLMTGMELGDRWSVNARLWKRLPEGAASDDNPGINDSMGRGELSAFWNMDKDNTLGLTLRSSLSSSRRGSARLEWLQTLGTGLGGGKSNLRLHTQLFSGYGDSMVDFNRKRTVFSVGLSLVDF